jgi:hypothetical protein
MDLGNGRLPRNHTKITYVIRHLLLSSLEVMDGAHTHYASIPMVVSTVAVVHLSFLICIRRIKE